MNRTLSYSVSENRPTVRRIDNWLRELDLNQLRSQGPTLLQSAATPRLRRLSIETWWSAQDYAPGLVRLKGGCATLTLALHKLVDLEGLEPSTPCLRDRYSTY